MKTIVKKTIKIETKRHDFDNDFSYIEIWRNNTLTDCYFAEKQYIWPDGSLKNGGIKYFFSTMGKPYTEKEIKPLNYKNFNRFSDLFYLNKEGYVCPISKDNNDF